MLLCLLSPCCLEAYERETRDYVRPHPCPDCGALLVMSDQDVAHLVLQCRHCDHRYERMAARNEPGMPRGCPRCGELAWPSLGPDDLIDIARPAGVES